MARFRNTTTTKNKKRQTYTITLELMTPVRCTFEVEAESPADAIDQAMDLDWDDPENYGPDGDGPTYCVEIADEEGNELSVPREYSADTINKENQ